MNIANVSRRNFLKGSGVFVLGAALPARANLPDGSVTAAFEPNLFVALDTDGTVTVTSHRSEMGQGIRTAIAQVVADELDADWARVKLAQAPGDAKYGDQNTDGSRSILMNYDRLRDAGAAARLMLRQAAAAKWGVPLDEVSAENHRVAHAGSGQSADYGEFAADAAKLPVPETVARKSESEHRFIGKPVVHVDNGDIARGKGNYGADVKLPNMAIAVIVRCPWLGGGVEKVADPEPRAGLIGLEVIDPAPPAGPMFAPWGGVAVLAEDTWTALSVARELDIEWTGSPNQGFSSDSLQAELKTMLESPGQTLFDIGNVDAAFDSDGQELSAVYETPFLGHMPMEPPAAVASVEEGSCRVFASVQDPQSTRGLVSQYLGMPLENVDVRVTLLGGAFGRKSKPDFVLEAVELSKRLKRPVRVQWTREDDVRHDYYHAASAQFHRAMVDDKGHPTAWLQRTAFPSITTVFSGQALMPAEWELEMGFTNLPYRVSNQRMESAGIRPGVRVGWMRSVCNIFHSFSANVFADEMAAAAGRDAIDHRLEILAEGGEMEVPGMQPPPGHAMDIGRLRHVIEKVRELSEWDRERPEGTGLGFAVHHSFRSYVAIVLEARMEAGRPKVTNSYVALDCGTHVNPDTCAAQMEGAVVFGLSLALHGEITMQDGQVQQSNFHDYPMLRMNEAPPTMVHVVPSQGRLPAGVGEPGVPPVAPALSNALFAATGTRYRSLPIRMA